MVERKRALDLTEEKKKKNACSLGSYGILGTSLSFVALFPSLHSLSLSSQITTKWYAHGHSFLSPLALALQMPIISQMELLPSQII